MLQNNSLKPSFLSISILLSQKSLYTQFFYFTEGFVQISLIEREDIKIILGLNILLCIIKIQ